MVILQSLVHIGQSLGFNSLAGIRHQKGALTGRKGTRNLISKIHVARSIHQVQLIRDAVFCRIEQPNRLGLDRDTSFPLNIHIIEHLIFRLAGI